MKKKGFVVLAVAAVLTLGTATMSAWAAEGWARKLKITENEKYTL